MAEVAGTDISVQEVSREFDNRVARMQEQFGASLDRRAAASLGVMQQAVDASVARRLVDAHARDLQLTAADDTVAEHHPPGSRPSRAMAGSSASGSTSSCGSSG